MRELLKRSLLTLLAIGMLSCAHRDGKNEGNYSTEHISSAAGSYEHLPLARALSRVKNSHGGTLFNSDQISLYIRGEENLQISALKKLTQYKSADGKTIIDDGQFIIDRLDQGYDTHDLIRLLELKNPDGSRVFDKAEDIKTFTTTGHELHVPEILVGLNQQGRKLHWNGRVLADFIARDGTFDYAKSILPYVSTGAGISMCWNRGVKKEDFNPVDTTKPNALIIMPGDDGDGAFGEPWDEVEAFYLERFDEMRTAYDIWVCVAGNEGQTYTTAANIPNIKFLDIGGHSDEAGTNLNERLVAQGDETGRLGFEDTEIGTKLLSKLDKDAVIFLEGCATNYGPGRTFAQFIASQAGGRTVYAAKDSFTDAGLTLTSAYPFVVKIVDEEGKDITSVLNN